ncbi:flagellar type III secretion system pore protein FliP [Lacisediminimonas profundi]|uniref:flagellar type III secretion system pore protein FliP n=1 Tax=Lacisediminimonas profundi TaxID=2603856 RepID=UPI00124B6379|nr:flagellar type III secretion system pore protein FliP [Lacisediminimonas profundi]
MNRTASIKGWRWLGSSLLLLACAGAEAAAPSNAIELRLFAPGGSSADLAMPIRILLLLSLLSLAPAILVTMTAFTRIVVVLAMLRHAIGMPETPPNQVLVSLALFLSLFAMMPVLSRINDQAWQPYSAGKMESTQALDIASAQMRDFMLRQTREADLALMSELAHVPPPKRVEDVSLVQLTPAFMLSELRAAFQIGFMIFLPFVMIDLVVSSVLMSLGMMMVPPVMVSLPLKILTFVLIDGWNLVARSLLASFH